MSPSLADQVWRLRRAAARRLPPPRFSAAARRAAAGKRILITGATGDIGEATATALVRSGATVLVHGRSPERLAATLARLAAAAAPGAQVLGYRADLSDGREVDALAARIRADHPALDGLINNAALGVEPVRQVDAQGLERVWSTNVLAPWRLTAGLAPSLAAAGGARVLNVVSGLTQDIGTDLMLAAAYDPIHAYARSKQALIAVGIAQSERFRAAGITVNALDPGTVDTAMAAGFDLDYRGAPPDVAAQQLARMMTEPSLAGVTGRLFLTGRRIRPPDQVRDPDFRNWLIGQIERQIGPNFVPDPDPDAAPAPTPIE